jgi:hypothetical protein
LRASTARQSGRAASGIRIADRKPGPRLSGDDDFLPGRRGGLRSHRGEGGRTSAQLYAEAAKANIKGSSKTTKAELERAVGR